jgi:hypothetical protein
MPDRDPRPVLVHRRPRHAWPRQERRARLDRVFELPACGIRQIRHYLGCEALGLGGLERRQSVSFGAVSATVCDREENQRHNAHNNDPDGHGEQELHGSDLQCSGPVSKTPCHWR